MYQCNILSLLCTLYKCFVFFVKETSDKIIKKLPDQLIISNPWPVTFDLWSDLCNRSVLYRCRWWAPGRFHLQTRTGSFYSTHCFCHWAERQGEKNKQQKKPADAQMPVSSAQIFTIPWQEIIFAAWQHKNTQQSNIKSVATIHTKRVKIRKVKVWSVWRTKTQFITNIIKSTYTTCDERSKAELDAHHFCKPVSEFNKIDLVFCMIYLTENANFTRCHDTVS